MVSVMYKSKKAMTAFADGTELGTSSVQKRSQFTQEKANGHEYWCIESGGQGCLEQGKN